MSDIVERLNYANSPDDLYYKLRKEAAAEITRLRAQVISESEQALAGLKKYDEDNTRLRARVKELEKLVYVPGLWRCAKCGFQLVQANLNALDGSVTARDTSGDKCPNCDSHLWRVTERQAGNDMIDRAEKEIIERNEAVARAERAEAELARIRGWNSQAGAFAIAVERAERAEADWQKWEQLYGVAAKRADALTERNAKLEAELAQERPRIKHMEGVLYDAQVLLGTEDIGELITGPTGPIARLIERNAKLVEVLGGVLDCAATWRPRGFSLCDFEEVPEIARARSALQEVTTVQPTAPPSAPPPQK